MTKRNGTNRQDGSYGPGGENAPKQKSLADMTDKEQADALRQVNKELATQLALTRQIERQKKQQQALDLIAMQSKARGEKFNREQLKLEQSLLSAKGKQGAHDQKKKQTLASELRDHIRMERTVNRIEKITGSRSFGGALLLAEAVKNGAGLANVLGTAFEAAGAIWTEMRGIYMEQKALKIEATEFGKAFGMLPDDFKTFAAEFADWDQALALPEGWSKNFVNELDNLGIKGEHAKGILMKFRQVMAPENLGSKKGQMLENAWLGMEKESVKVGRGKNFKFSEKDILERFSPANGGNQDLMDIVSKSMKGTKKHAFTIDEFNELMTTMLEKETQKGITYNPKSRASKLVDKGKAMLGDIGEGFKSMGDTLDALLEGDIDELERADAVEFKKRDTGLMPGEGGDIGAGTWWGAIIGSRTKEEKAQNNGYQLGEAVTDGFDSGTDGFPKVLEGKMKDAMAGAMDAADIHSPSGETRWMGQMLQKGLVGGLHDGQPEVSRALASMVSTPDLGSNVSNSSTNVNVAMGPTQVFANEGASAKELGEDLASEQAMRLFQYLSSIAGQLGSQA